MTRLPSDHLERVGEGEEEVVDESTQTDESGISDAALLAGIVSDPDVAAVLAAKRANKVVKVSTDEEEVEVETEDEGESTDGGEGEEEHSDEVRQVIAVLKAQLKPVTERLENLEGVAQNYQRQAANVQINEVSSRYKDFEKYRKSMAELSESHPGLGVEELYILAKHKADDLVIVQPSTESERPTPIPRTQPLTKEKRGSRHGRRGFQNIMADALKRVDFSTQ